VKWTFAPDSPGLLARKRASISLDHRMGGKVRSVPFAAAAFA
jgi:hypothetical protein